MEIDPNQEKKKKQPLIDLAKYSSMGIQMLAIMGFGTWLGIKIDDYFNLNKTPVFTIVFALLSVVFAIYFVLKDLLKK